MSTETARMAASAVGRVRDLVMLFKLRIVLLLLFAAVAGAFLAAEGAPDGSALGVLLLAGGTTAAGASALNEYLERHRDGKMRRTERRPLVTGTLAPSGWLLALALGMTILPAVLVLPAHPDLALFLILGAIIYVGVYTLWLKARTPLNIVIGGAAGSCAVLSGGAALHGWADPGVLALALLVFFWTPIHFWALAIVYRDDYARGGVPMLPVVTTVRRAAVWSLLHGMAAGALGIGLVLHPGLGVAYLVPACAATALLLWQACVLVAWPSTRHAWHLFHSSNLYLALILLAVCLTPALPLP
jgi:protoheme IX farnesyltransferase